MKTVQDAVNISPGNLKLESSKVIMTSERDQMTLFLTG